MVHKKKTSKAFFFFCPQEPQAALHVPNVRAKCLLKFQLRPVMEWQRLVCPSIPPNLANIAPQLRALPCHRKQSGMDHCTQPLSSSFFFFNLILQVSGFFFFYTPSVKQSRSASGSDVKRIPVFPASVFPGSDVCLTDFVSRSLEMPSPPATMRSL